MSFNHNEIEKKWQDEWERHKCFHCKIDKSKKKFYALDMFPYPSGAGLHVGHLASYTPAEIISRYKRAKGFNVLHPIGYDAFGLPAEQYAIQTGIHPKEITKKAIQNFKRQLQSFGFSFDWSREISTCDPSYYKWTQKLFIHFFNRKLAYRKKMPVNWCPQLRTILANEEVVNGKSERGGHPVYKKNIDQWMLKITDYADSLQEDLKEVDFPERTKEGQKNWIGKSDGVYVYFPIQNSSKKIKIFTTRPDTLFGATFVVLSSEHFLIEEEFSKNKEYSSILEYQKKCLSISDVDKKKNITVSGVFSGSYAIHPLTQKEIPVWIADYVLMEYGTGAIMAVPAHDERDFGFAKKFNLPIQSVMEHSQLPYTGDGKYIHSQFINGLHTKEAIQKMIEHLEKHHLGSAVTQYKLRDWIFSRQRYWGEPFPLVCINQQIQPVSDDELPVELPETVHYEPSEKGEPPLARIKSFVNYKEGLGKRETDTMPGSAASSWYFLRYTDPHNDQKPFDFSAQEYWMPVDLYVGGAEHTVGHLLYARFWQKVLYDAGWVSHKEPFKKLVHQGSILGSDGQRMSKSKGNTVSPDKVRSVYGADATRLYISFLGPFDKDKPWSDTGIEGCRRFLDRVWRLVVNDQNQVITNHKNISPQLETLLHQTIKKVTEDIESLHFNTAISAMMILVNEMYLAKSNNHKVIKIIIQLLQPFAPHLSEELWHQIGEKSFVSLEPWPIFDEEKVIVDQIQLAIQVNGKLKDTVLLAKNTEEKEAVEKAQKLSKVAKALKEKNIQKVIYRKGRILNFVCQ